MSLYVSCFLPHSQGFNRSFVSSRQSRGNYAPRATCEHVSTCTLHVMAHLKGFFKTNTTDFEKVCYDFFSRTYDDLKVVGCESPQTDGIKTFMEFLLIQNCLRRVCVCVCGGDVCVCVRARAHICMCVRVYT